MRRHAKASTAGSTKRQAGGLALTLAALLLWAGSASAATVTDRPLLFTFNGSDTTAGTIEELRGGLAVDESSGNVYALDLVRGVVDKFNADGVAANFSATGTSSLNGSGTPDGEFKFDSGARIAVDDSPVNTGRIYVANNVFGNPRVDAFSPSGTFLWRLATHACGVAVDTAGHLWVGDNVGGEVREYASTGSPPAEIGSFAASSPCQLDIAKNGDVYVIGSKTLRKYVGGALSSTVDTDVQAVAVDQSSLTGHVFSLHQGNSVGDSFKEFDSTGSEVGTFGAGLLYESPGIAYNSALDRVYVAQFVGLESEVKTGTVKALGPIATGTVPDATSEAATEIEVSKAQLNGKVNPQSVPNAYFFEWHEGTAAFQWRRAKSSAPQTLVEDSTDHPVSFNATNLKGGTTYEARLVGLNSTSGLRSVSAPVTFTTAIPATAPAVTIAAPSAVTTTSAEVSGTIDPVGDFGATWRLQLSTDPACASDFSNQAIHNLESEANSPLAASQVLTGLLPSQHYCVRISATNGFGTTTSEIKQFSTAPIAPDHAFTAFAAPRTDTGARLNGRVNPEGELLIYRFEYSKDGGATWVALADREDASEARRQIVVGEELTELEPNTTYSYRFVAENSTGGAVPQGEEKTFTTRTTAEMSPPTRGIELVNSPDKGNQNEINEPGVPVVSPDGEKALWLVTGGAPGSPNGARGTFLAERTPGGWQSRSLAPPAAQQLGGGGFTYQAKAITPDFGHFVFEAKYAPSFGSESEATNVRLDAHQHQDILQTYNWTVEHDGPGHLEMTDDGTHVIDINHASDQLEEIGDGSGEVLSLMPDETPSSCGLDERASFGGPGKRGGGAEASAFLWREGYRLIATTDASLVYFEAKPNGECTKPWGLYLRDRDAEETVLIDPGTLGDVAFIRATPDGRHGYFATRSQLDPADPNEHTDIYRWDRESEESTCLTCIVADAAVEIGFGRVMISDDFSHVYFVSTKQLVPDQGDAGQASTYALSGGTLRFVAPVAALDGAAKLSEDGSKLIFLSGPSPLLTADQVEVAPGSLELYRYEEGEESIECLSCAHGGVTKGEAAINGSESSMSADGSTVAFVTPEALAPLDVNRGDDVYEWRNGARRLITNGVTEFKNSDFVKPGVKGIDADGSNVIFSVAQPGLTGFELDGLANLYDARIGGGFEPPSPPVHCDGDSCQGPLVAPPSAAPSASSGFIGHGNLAPPEARKRRPCARKRGEAKRRCIRKHKRRSQRARAHSNAGRTK